MPVDDDLLVLILYQCLDRFLLVLRAESAYDEIRVNVQLLTSYLILPLIIDEVLIELNPDSDVLILYYFRRD